MEKNTKDVIRFWMTQAHNLTSSQSHKLTSSQAHKLTSSLAHKLTISQAHKLTSSQADKLAHRPTDRVAGGADAGSGDSWQLLVPVQASHLGNNRSKVSKAGRSNHRGSVIPEEEVRGRWPRGPLGSSVGRLHKCGSSPEWRKLRVQTAAARQQPGSVVGAGALLGAGGPGGRCRGCAPWAGP